MAVIQPYIVLKQESRTSKKYGTPMTKITFLGVKDRKEYVTYVDAPHRNYKNWQHIINNPNHGFVLSNLTFKKYKDDILIDADSKPLIQREDVNDKEIMEELAEIWAEEDRRNNTDKFSDLFPGSR